MTFQNLLEQLEKKKPDLGGHIDTFQTFIGAVACLAGDSAAGGLPALLAALAEKEKLFDLGKFLLDRIAGEKPEDYSGIDNQMRAAYGTLCFTAFFDELNDSLPKEIRRKIQLRSGEAQTLFMSSVPQAPQTDRQTPQTNRAENRQNRINAIPLVFPDAFYGSAKAEQDLEKFYRSMADRLSYFIEKTSFSENADEREKRILRETISGLPKNAVNQFHDQFLTLCDKIPTFRVYVQEEQISALYNELCQQPARIRKERVQEIADNLIEKYHNNINRPLIQDEDKTESLCYPALDRAFIPQRYQLLRYAGKEQRLELAETWKEAETRNDMMDFWKGYLLDPNSVYTPLLILGEPGSGKSCLTEIVCGRMSAENNIMVRIPLREYDLEDEIESIVCRQIVQDGDADDPFHKLKKFAAEFPCSPLTLFFDGYDEVMQATGGVYRNLLNRIQRFQDDCRKNGRPVRVVITSRDTLIDKADIPTGTAVMKLLNFDNRQKRAWIDVWNDYNRDILKANGIDEFSLPDNSSLDALSGQPLLLLMLAIYDADFERHTNALRQRRKQGGDSEQDKDLDRTGLYDELLRRFIRRELRKGKRGQDDYLNADNDGRQWLEDEEMKKLGVAALGMFVREKLSLSVGEFADDLQTMKARLPEYKRQSGQTLNHAHLFFGSFFFIHKPKGPKNGDENEAEFEFLHKTFYEFLLADLTLQYYMDTLENLRQQKNLPKSKHGGLAYVDTLDVLDQDQAAGYYAALNGVCLCTEPESAKMTAEWTECKRARFFQGDTSDFEAVFADLFNSHFRSIRDGVFRPAWKNGGLTGERKFPQLCAVYLMNLLTMRILTCGQCDIPLDDWKYLALYLKLNLPAMKRETEHKWNIEPSEEIILKFIELFHFTDNEVQESNCVHLERWPNHEAPALFDLTNIKAWLSAFLQDTITGNLYILHDTHTNEDNSKKAYRNLIKLGMPLYFEHNLLRLHEAILYPEKMDDGTLCDLFAETWRNDKSRISLWMRHSLTWDWLQCVRTLIRQRPGLKQADIHGVISALQELTSDSFPAVSRCLAQEILHDLDVPLDEP